MRRDCSILSSAHAQRSHRQTNVCFAGNGIFRYLYHDLLINQSPSTSRPRFDTRPIIKATYIDHLFSIYVIDTDYGISWLFIWYPMLLLYRYRFIELNQYFVDPYHIVIVHELFYSWYHSNWYYNHCSFKWNLYCL